MSVPSSCDVSDACDDLGVPAVRTGVFRPVWPGCPPVAGPLTTWRAVPGDAASAPLAGQFAALERTPGEVLLVDLGGRADLQCWGGVLATAARHWGVRGVLVNGCVRDVAELAALEYPAFARGVFPARNRGRLRLAGTDVDVTLPGGGVAHPGDMVVADSSGAVFFAASDAARVFGLARAQGSAERRRLDAIRVDGADPADVFLKE